MSKEPGGSAGIVCRINIKLIAVKFISPCFCRRPHGNQTKAERSTDQHNAHGISYINHKWEGGGGTHTSGVKVEAVEDACDVGCCNSGTFYFDGSLLSRMFTHRAHQWRGTKQTSGDRSPEEFVCGESTADPIPGANSLHLFCPATAGLCILRARRVPSLHVAIPAEHYGLSSARANTWLLEFLHPTSGRCVYPLRCGKGRSLSHWASFIPNGCHDAGPQCKAPTA